VQVIKVDGPTSWWSFFEASSLTQWIKMTMRLHAPAPKADDRGMADSKEEGSMLLIGELSSPSTWHDLST
jgi:hypothetical protein